MTLASMGCHPLSVVTAITIQDTTGVETMLPDRRRSGWPTRRAACSRTCRSRRSRSACSAAWRTSPRSPKWSRIIPRCRWCSTPCSLPAAATSWPPTKWCGACASCSFPRPPSSRPNSLEARRLAAEDEKAKDSNSPSARGACIATGCEYVLVTGTHENTAQVVNTLYGQDGVLRAATAGSGSPAAYHGSGLHARLGHRRHHRERPGDQRRGEGRPGIHLAEPQGRIPPRHGAAHSGSTVLGTRRGGRRGREVPVGVTALARPLRRHTRGPDTARLLRTVVQRGALGRRARCCNTATSIAARALRLEQARALHVAVPMPARAPIVNDTSSSRARVDADGVHLGRDDTAIASARAQLGRRPDHRRFLLRQLDRARASAERGRRLRRLRQLLPVSREARRDARRRSNCSRGRAARSAVPVVAIGGITLANAASADRRRRRRDRRHHRDLLGTRSRAAAREFAPLFDKENLRHMSSRDDLFERSQRFIPGGVNSPVRAFRSVGGTPLFVERGSGAHLMGRGRQALHRLRRFVGSARSSGTPHPEVVAAVAARSSAGSFLRRTDDRRAGNGRSLCRLVPSHGAGPTRQLGHRSDHERDPPRARIHRSRRIVKFEGCYHGHADALLVKAGSGALTLGQPSSAGVPPEVAAHTLVLDYNDVAALESRVRAVRAARSQPSSWNRSPAT